MPKLFTIDAKTKPLPSRKIYYDVLKKDTNITLKKKSVVIPLREAKWITAKLNRCIRNNKKLTISNDALNQQIKRISDE